MTVKLAFFESEIEVPYLWSVCDGQAYYRRPYLKSKSTKTSARTKQVLLPVTAPESLAVI